MPTMMNTAVTLLGLCHFYLVGAVMSTVLPQCSTYFDWIFDDTCTRNWRCIWKQSVIAPGCKKANTVYSLETLYCVEKGSSKDTCHTSPCASYPCQNGGTCFFGRFSNQYQCQCPYSFFGRHCEQKLTSLEAICDEKPDAIIPDPLECQLYYNCSLNYQYVPWYYSQHMQECPYLQLFDLVRQICVNFTEVQCGNRRDPKEWCNYRKSRCVMSHCIPCEYVSPSCKDYSDGMHADRRNPGAPLYIICQQEYTIGTGRCPNGENGPLFVGPDGNCSSSEYMDV